MMKPLIDADVLRYEVGAVGSDEDGTPRSFDYVAEVLDGKIRDICAAVGATEPPRLYLTGKGNFRIEVAKTKPYKGQRKQEKPYHFTNLTNYMLNVYDTVVVDGMEADDMMCIDQTEDTIICTRDKDLRMMPGWHYGWECGRQREFGPVLVDEAGFLILNGNKLTGAGMIFFWAQMLMGDSTDNIPGCPGIGPKKAYLALTNTHPDDHEGMVQSYYHMKKCSYEMFMEQAYLLWMVRELDEDGNPVMWRPSED